MSDVVTIGKTKGSSAASTDFVHEKIDGPGGLHLFVDGNQKVSGWEPRPNAFSLPEIASCPFRTPSCEKACYVAGLKAARPDIYALYEHNFETIKEIVGGTAAGGIRGSYTGKQLWAAHLGEWIAENCAETGFRWHVSGDVFSAEYARFIRQVVFCAPGVQHWIYTRSFPHVEQILPVRRYITINLSADKDNYWLARRYADQLGLRVCYLTSDGVVPDDLKPGDVVFPDYRLRERDLAPAVARGESTWYQSLSPVARAGVCPADFFGKSERRRCSPPGGGGCSKCTEAP